MHEWTESDSLRLHMETVAASMGAYSDRLAPDERDDWLVTGLLHDFDYEKHPTPEEHPRVGVAELERLGVSEVIRTAIMGHAEYTGVPRESPMAKALFAVDELSGFIVACARVRPEGIATLEPKSVKKKLKDSRFAAAVSREDIHIGVEELGALTGLDQPEHIAVCIAAIRAEAERFGI